MRYCVHTTTSSTGSVRTKEDRPFFVCAGNYFFGLLLLLFLNLEVFAQCPTTITTQPVSQTVCGSGTATVTFSVSTDGTPDSYQWYKDGFAIDTSATLTINNVVAGNLGSYHVEISKFGCVNVVSNPVSLSFYSITTTNSHTDVLCNGGATGTITVSGAGGSLPYSYTIAGPTVNTSGATNGFFTGLTAGDYTVIVSDANGCTTTLIQTIAEPSPLTATSSHANVLCNGGTTGTMTAAGAGGSLPYNYTIAGPTVNTTGATNGTFTGLAAGDYIVTVTDASGCTATSSQTITEPGALTASSSHTNVLCNGGTSGTMTAEGAGGISPYSYSIAGPTVNTIGASTGNFTGLTAGVYTITVTDANGCNITTSQTITEPGAFTATGSHTNVLCNGGTTGTMTAAGAGGTFPYNYVIAGPTVNTTGAVTGNFTGLTAGAYTITVTDANGCNTTTSQTIAQPAILTATSSHANVLCNGETTGSMTAAGAGGVSPYSYSIAGPTVNTTGATTGNFTGLTAGIYIITVTDANGCTTTTSQTITQPATLTATSSYTNVLCNGGTTGTMTATGAGGTTPYNYVIAGPTVNTTGASSGVFTGLADGIYTISVTDANGCTTTTSQTITEPAILSATSIHTNVLCNGGTTGTMTATGAGGIAPYNYVIAGPTVNTTGASSGVFTGLTDGTYTITVTDANGCATTTSQTIAEPAILSATSTHTNVLCNGGTTGTMTATGAGGVAPYNYVIAGPTINSTGVSSGVFIGLSDGSYTITVTDANGCTTTTSQTITEPAVLSATSSPTNVLCNSGTTGIMTAAGTGGTTPYSYVIAGPTINTTGAVNGIFTGLTAGIYIITVTDANGCTTTTSQTITQPATLTATSSYTNVLCNGGTTGTMTATGAGGTTPYNYVIAGPTVNTTGASSGVFTGLADGIYTISVTDANGCTTTTSQTITEPAILSATSIHTNVLCNGGTTGTMTATGAGGIAPYNHVIAGPTVNTTGASSGVFTGLTDGTYTITVTDANGCTTTTSQTIAEPAILSATSTHTNVLCNGGTTGTMTATGAGGVAPYNYLIAGPTINSTGVSSGVFIGLSDGSYTITVTDANGCTTTTSQTITEPAVLSATSSPTNVLCNGGTTGIMTAAGTGGTTPYSYVIAGPTVNTTGAVNGIFTGLIDGTYTVTVTDANGCTTTTSQTITEPPPINITSLSSNTPVCTGSTLDLNATATGGSGALSYSWSGPGGFSSIQQNALLTNVTIANNGIYSLTVTDANNCSASQSTSVTVTALPTAIITYAGTPFCTTIGSAQSVTLSGTGAYTVGTYSSSPAGLTINASGAITPSTSTAGTYTVTYTIPAAGGCPAVIATTSVTITAIPTATISYPGTPFCSSVATAPVTLNGTGAYLGGTFSAPAGLTINSSTGEITPGTSTPGSYTVTYTIPASDGCAAVPVTTSVTITALPTVAISYGATLYCKSIATAQAVTRTGTGAFTAGTYSSSPAGLTISATTGAITPGTSTAGTYIVAYTIPAAGGCPAVIATTSVTITAIPTATISYPGTPFCSSVTTAPVTLNGTGAYTGGTFSAPAGLTINSSTGEISPGTSTPGSYTVTYTIPASDGCAAVAVTTPVTITALPTVSISYGATPYCRSLATAQAVTRTGTGAFTAGTYSSSPAGLTINASGAITPSTSTAGTYTVTYTIPAAGGCPAVIATTSVTITAIPTATISYPGTPFCSSVATAPITLNGTGVYTGGTFSAPAGLTINSSTGEITPGTSTPGTYTVTYTIPASDGCAAVAVSTPVTITALPTVSISYGATPYCKSIATAQAATRTGTGAFTAGTYSSSPAGLTISATGAITPSTSTAGTYTVTYTIPAAGGCPAVIATTSVTITAIPTATISYPGTPFCSSVATAPITLNGTGVYTGGTFSAPAGLTINSSTGEITPGTSTPGTYTVTYTIPASDGCAAVAVTTPVTITALPTVSISYTATAYCRSASTQAVTRTGTGAFLGGTYTFSPAGLTISSSTGTITPSTSTPGTYTVTYTTSASGGCPAVTTTTSVTITAVPTASISYASPFCAALTTPQAVTLSGTGAYTGGTFSAPAALSINSSNGETNPGNSTPGTYTVTYTIPASGGCAAVNVNTTVTITSLPTVSISYGASPYCKSLTTAQGVTRTGTGAFTGGTYTSSPAGLIINASSGAITPSTSTPGTYTVTYTISASGGCPAVTTTTSVTITAVPTASISYASPFCTSVTTPQAVNLNGTGAYTGGTFSAPAGLSINSSTGEINPGSSTAGSYTVTYTIPASAGCAAINVTTPVFINTTPAISPGTINPVCSNGLATTASMPYTITGGVPNQYSVDFDPQANSAGFIDITNATLSTSPRTISIPAGVPAGTYNAFLTVRNSANLCVSSVYPISITIFTRPSPTITGPTPACLNTVNTYFTEPGMTGYTWVPGTGGTIVSGAGTNTVQISWSSTGTKTVTVNYTDANGCNATTASTYTVSVVANPATPTSPVNATRCGPGTLVLGASSAAGTTIDWYDAAIGGNLVGSGTSFTTPVISSTTTYYAQARNTTTGCVSATRTAVTATINTLPSTTVPTPTAICAGNSVTLTANGASTYAWSPPEGLSITTGPTVIASPEATTTYTVVGTGANGCTNATTVTVTITPTPKGDITSSPPVCSGNNNGIITLFNYTGSIVHWESSVNGGSTWTTINNTSATQPYSNLTQTTIYRVLLTMNNGCDAYSDLGIVPVNEPFIPEVTVNPPIICLGESATLRASDYGAPPFPLEDFQRANPAGWSGNDANNNNEDENTDWGETGNGKVRYGKVYNSNALPTSSKFMIIAGVTDEPDRTADLITPPFSLVGVVNPVFGFMTALDLTAGTTASVEISIDGGLTYITLESFTGPAKVGNGNNGFVQRNYNLSAFIGQPDVRVRFHYVGTAGSIWAVDNVGLQGSFEPVTYQWSPLDYMTPAAGNTQNVTVTPPVGMHQYCVVATTGAGCASEPVCEQVEVKPLPTCEITGINTVCPGSLNIYSGPAVAGYTYQWTITGSGVISGSSTSQTVTVVANNNCGAYTLRLVTRLNGCNSAPCTFTVNVVDTEAPVMALGSIAPIQCNPTQAQINAAVIPPSVTDNCTAVITATFVDAPETGAPGCLRTVIRTWTATDLCGNTTTATQTITFTRDTQLPVITVSAAGSVICNPTPDQIIAAFGTATVTDNCSPGLTASFSDGAETGTACNRSLTRTWTVADACGNTAIATQTVNFTRDTVAPVITVTAATNPVCNPTAANIAAAFGTASVTDNCSTGLTATFTDAAETGTGCDRSITRTWTVSDACGNTASTTQTINFTRDTELPVIALTAATNPVCNPTAADIAAAFGTASVTDNCSAGLTATFTDDAETGTGCDRSITRTWTVTDDCGNSATTTQTINFTRDTELPVITLTAATNPVCNPTAANITAAFGTASVTDNCSTGLTATFTDGAETGTGCDRSVTRTWTVTDACGNTATTTQTINFTRDTEPPAISCTPTVIFCAINDNNYTVPSPVASDNCNGPLTITYQITGTTLRSGTGSDASGQFNLGNSTILWTVTDACGNTSTCTTQVTINPKPAPIISHN